METIKEKLQQIHNNGIHLVPIVDIKMLVEGLVDASMYDEAVNLVKEFFNLEFKADFLENGLHFQGDKETRDIYNITLKRGQRKYSFKFGQSIINSGFYAQYGRQKYNVPRERVNQKSHELKAYVKHNFNHDFGNSSNDKINFPKEPTLYDVLACLQKYEVGTFEDFCSEFGYDNDSRTAKKTYKAVVKEYDKMCSLFSNDELEVLQHIS